LKAKYNILFTAQVFLQKKEKVHVAKTSGHKIHSDVALAGKKEGSLSFASFVNYTRLLFLSFAIQLCQWVILIPVCIPAPRSGDFLDLVFFQTTIDIERQYS